MRKLYKYAFLLALLAGPVSASVIINQTRVIYPSNANNVTVQLLNKSRTVHLVQSWIDDGNPEARPEDIRVPLLVTPPVVKINANGGQSLKISVAGSTEKLPKDRESVFYLNVLDVPPMPDNKDANYMQVALRNRIKLFWRPNGLALSQKDIPEHVSLSKSKEGKSCINNNTPYYLTIVQIMRWDGKSTSVQTGVPSDNFLKKAAFIPPYTCVTPENTGGILKSGKYQFVRMDDYGSKVPFIVNI